MRHERVALDAAAQAGIVSRQQLLARDWTDKMIGAQIAAGRWRIWTPGVILTHTNEPSELARVWAVVVSSPANAVVSHESAAWLHGLLDRLPSQVHLQVRIESHHRRSRGVYLHRSTHRPQVRTMQGLAVTSVEDTVLDLIATAGTDTSAIDWIMTACQRRRTTPRRLLQALDARRRPRRAALLREICADVAAGMHSPLERRYQRTVERAHGLPAARRQLPVVAGGRSMFVDVAYETYGVVVELDGRLGHEDGIDRFRDRTRDNVNARRGRVTLRYGWREVVEDPCGVAGEVAQVLHKRGSPPSPTHCGPTCTAAWGFVEDH